MKAENTTKIQFDSLSVNESYARGAAAAFLARYDPTVPQLADIKTAVSEAVTNCIVHAYPDHIGPVAMSIAVYPGREVHITVADKGIGIPDIPQAMEPLFTTGNPEERSGLGFAVMQSFMDKVKVSSQPGKGTRVVLTSVWMSALHNKEKEGVAMVTDKTRRSTFIEQNLGLVHSCAGRFRGRGIEYDDLYSAGCMGLVKAYDGFDESRGVCFSTYAVPVILGEIKKLFRDGGTVKVSRSLKELSLRINAAREHHSKLCGAEPTLSQLAEELGESVENITLAIQAAQPALSLTPENREEGDRQMDIPVESPEEELADKIGLAEVLKSLPEEDRLIIQLRFYGGKTQSDTAKLLHTTQVQISRRERKILKVMRDRLLDE